MAEAKWVTPDELQKLVSAVPGAQAAYWSRNSPRAIRIRRFKRQRLPAA